MALELVPEARISSISQALSPVVSASRIKNIRLLAYVHLRNIHASTGAGRVARQLVEHLALREEVDLRILADESDKQRVLPFVGEPWQSFKYSTFATDTSVQQARWLALNSPVAERFWPEADIVYCTGESYVPSLKARLAVTVHDAAYFEPRAHKPTFAFWKQQFKWRILFRRLEQRADMIHTVSEFSAARLGHFFPGLKSRIRVVANAVTPLFFGPVSNDGQRFVHEIIGDRPFVLVPGGLHHRKNAELILAAANRLLQKFPDILLVISGHNNTAYASQAAALNDRILQPGFVEDSALHALYSAAIAVWFPSLYEGFGMPALEAMASGTPVVASAASALPEIAGHAALFANPTDPDEHIEKLAAVISDGALHDQLAGLGRARALMFTWNRSAVQLQGYFRELV